MSQLEVTPDELDRFARMLQGFNIELQGQSRRITAEFGRLGDTWRDQEHQRFADEFQKTMAVIERFIQVSEEQVPFLTRKAERAREYLRQR